MNPLKQFREMEHLTQEDMADQCGLSRIAYLRTEQGVFNHIPPSILEFIVRRGYSADAFATSYQTFIDQQRQESFGELTEYLPPLSVFNAQLDFTFGFIFPLANSSSNLSPSRPPAPFATYLAQTRSDDDELLLSLNKNSEYRDLSHPFIQWRLLSGIPSQISICKYYCVHPAHLSSYELKANYIHTPPQLILALRESGYAASVLIDLDQRYVTYRKRLVASQTKQHDKVVA